MELLPPPPLAAEVWVSEPVVKNRPFTPGAVTVVSLSGLPTSTLPWNCAVPPILAVVASGKFHNSRSRRAFTGSVSLRSPV